ncbi:MAG: amidohydrolase family protein [Proteobacteria bacterium]|nr:amidohydrolase family protein [Pseudomonadota bacterium]
MTDPFWMPRMGLREDWLNRSPEPVLDPTREIVDPHHHLWNRGGHVYETAQLAADAGDGHNVVQTVYIECHSYYDTDAPEGFEPIGESRTVADMATRLDAPSIAGIVAFADLRRPDLDAILDAHAQASGGLVKGIRQAGAFDSDPDVLRIKPRGQAGLYADPDFRRGLARLAARGLTYDTWHYHHQAADFLALARAVPDTTLVLDHFGTPLGVGRFEGQRDAIFPQWQQDMAALARCPNVVAKLGGLAMPDNGWRFEDRTAPPSSVELADLHGPWYRHMLDCFGPERCMFESNFPVDRVSISYGSLWNAFKIIAEPFDEDEKNALFSGTARRIYRL